MGANGSFANGSTALEKDRRWKTILVLKDGTKIIELKNKKITVSKPTSKK